jgi:hypothetical protein
LGLEITIKTAMIDKKDPTPLSLIDFRYGFARVQLEHESWNFLTEKGTLLSDQNFIKVDDFSDRGFARVQLEDKSWKYIDLEGNLFDKLPSKNN